MAPANELAVEQSVRWPFEEQRIIREPVEILGTVARRRSPRQVSGSRPDGV